jgi:hypothetical protein
VTAEQEHRQHGHAMYRHLGDTAPDLTEVPVGADAGPDHELWQAALGVAADATMAEPAEGGVAWPT